MKVKPGKFYQFDPCYWDILDPPYNVKPGDVVQVKNLPGCPPANTMAHCHVVDGDGKFAGLVHTGSLKPV